METKNAIEHFDERAIDWDNLYSKPKFIDRLNLFVASTRTFVKPGSDILDYGCGGGMISRRLAKCDYHVTGIDGSLRMIEQAKSVGKIPESLNFHHIDPNGWVPDRKYNAIVCSSVLEYVQDDETLLSTFAEAISEDGHLFISVPSQESIIGKIEDLLSLGGKRDVQFAHRRYTDDHIRTKIQSCGLTWIDRINFELPLLGSFGIKLSRSPLLGVMKLVIARK